MRCLLPRSFTLSVIAASIATLPLAVFSQRSDDNSSVDQGLERIVVTGTLSQTTLSDLTSNLTQLSEEDITRISPTHINEVTSQVAGVWVSRGNGQEHLTAIRSPVLTGAGGCGAFFMAADGISLRAPGFCNANQLFGVNSEQAGAIEIVRGPGSVVYGANAVHGILNILSPSWDNMPSASVSFEAGPHDYHRAQFNLKNTETGTEEPEHKLSLYGNLTSDGGYKYESGFDQQKLNLQHEFSKDKYQIKNHFAFTNLNQETAGFIQGFEVYKDESLKRTNPNPEAFRDSRSILAYSQVNYQLSDHHNLMFQPYYRYHDMTFLQHFLPWKSLEENGHNSIGAKLHLQHQLDDSRFLVYGIDVDVSDGWLKETQEEPFSPTIPQGDHYDYEVLSGSYSPFIDLNWQINEKLQLNTGVRYEWQEYDYDNLLTAGAACEPDVDNCRFTRPEDQTLDFDNWSYRAGLNYQLSDQHQIYGQVSQGFRPPQATELFRLQAGQIAADLASEKLSAVEVGFRGGWQTSDESSFDYDITFYTMDKSHHIFQDTQRQYVSNGETQHDGIEITTRWTINPYWSLNFAATQADHEYKNNVNISRDVDITGNQIDTAPETTANINLLWQSDTAYAELEWSHMHDYFLDPANTATYDGHDLVNLRAGYDLAENWRLSLRVMNLLDEDYAERADFAFGNYRYFVGEPRSLYVGIRWALN